MRRFGGVGFVAAMESEKVAAGDDDKKGLGENAESLETDLAEVNDTSAEGASAQADADEAEGAATALESFRVALLGIQGSGGLHESGAAILNLAVEHFNERFGLSDKYQVPALESFGGASGRGQATSIAMEAISDKIKEIWKAIVAHIKKAVDWVVKYWNQVFGAAEKLKKRAQAIVAKAPNITGTQKEKTFDNDRLAKALAINNAMPQGAAVLTEAEKLKAATSEVVTRAAQVSGEVGEKAAEAVSELKGENVGAIVALLKPLSGDAVGNAEAEGLAGTGEGIKLTRGAQLFGGKALFSRTPSGTVDTADAASIKLLSQAGYSFGKYNKSIKDAPTSNKVTALVNTDCGKLADIVVEIADELLAYRKVTPKLVESQKKLASAAEKVADSAGSEEDEGKRKSLSALQGITTMANRVFTQPGAEFMRYALTTCKSLLDLAELSLAKYESK
jgi:hypothetical protein